MTPSPEMYKSKALKIQPFDLLWSANFEDWSTQLMNEIACDEQNLCK
jgi:hypothetical protein